MYVYDIKKKPREPREPGLRNQGNPWNHNMYVKEPREPRQFI